MADRTVAMLADSLIAMRARVGDAEVRHAAAIRAENAAREACDASAALVVAADADWSRQMAEGFDPVLGRLLAGEVCTAAARLVDAERTRADAGEACARAAALWQREDGRRRAIEEQAAIARRRARHRVAERLLATLADRETLHRCAR